MRWVQQAMMSPHRCAAVPYIGNSNSLRGFIDTGMDLPGWDPHVYISVEAVEQMARMVGWEPRSVAVGQAAKAGALEERVAELEAELSEATQKLEAVQVLKAAGYSAQRKPGRPRKAAA